MHSFDSPDPGISHTASAANVYHASFNSSLSGWLTIACQWVNVCVCHGTLWRHL